ncbi:uncharacterized protein B0H18DRAFT_1105364, partial [Fomitopsis serialis]|uniref:uncharacterized protein n=1 Tax=Fomitopsis serialis TaxID=139415 RepID=UPI002007F77F
MDPNETYPNSYHYRHSYCKGCNRPGPSAFYTESGEQKARTYWTSDTCFEDDVRLQACYQLNLPVQASASFEDIESRDMPTPELPIEIQEQVLDHLHDDPSALKTRIRRYKRRHARPGIALADDGLSAGAYGRQKGQRYDLLCQILRRVPNTDTLVDFLALANPKGTDTDLRGVFTSVFAFPQLKALVLQRTSGCTAREVLQLISAFPSLATLWISDITTSIPNDVQLNTRESTDIRICIQELRLGRWQGSLVSLQDMLGALLAAPYELQLRKLQWMPSLSLRHVEFGGHALKEIFHKSARTLETLELEVDRAGQRIKWLMDQGLSHYRSLNSLILSFDPMY